MEKTRKIIHIDMDAFFASVEIRDNPALRGLPVIVGGHPNSRGVVCTCSYEARRFGVHSGMASSRAKNLCPAGVFLAPRFEAYQEASLTVRRIFSDYTELVEPMSIDEAYLDVTENKLGIPYATRIAREIKARIRCATGGLTASAGVSFNKFFAKTASDIKKPDGLFVIRPDEAAGFLDTLPIGKFYGIGKVTEKFMLEKKIRNGRDLKKLSREQLVAWFGKTGGFYYEIARGIDEREVTPSHERKSLGVEETFQTDSVYLPEMLEVVSRQSVEVACELAKRKLNGRTVTLKIKFFDFKTITRSKSFERHLAAAAEIETTARKLLLENVNGSKAVRLLGVTVSNFIEERADAGCGSELIQPEFDFGEEL